MMSNMAKIKQIQQLSEKELEFNIKPSGSWHMKYKDSAYIYIGGFPYEMTEGDIVIVCSQYGEVVDCRIVRDAETGKSKGFGFVCYEDQRSTVLAVDNLNGADIGGRVIRVDHVEQYKIPREYFDVDDYDQEKQLYKPTGPDGKGWGIYRNVSEEDQRFFEEEKMKEEEKEKRLNKIFLNDDIIDDNDNVQWEKQFMEIVNNEKEKIIQEQAQREKKRLHKHKHKHHHKHKDKQSPNNR